MYIGGRFPFSPTDEKYIAAPKRIYVASGLKNYERVLDLRDKLSKHGVTLTYDCAAAYQKSRLSGENEADWKDIASAEFTAVCDAELVFFVCPGGRGSHFELGVACALNIPVVLLEDEPAAIAFYTLDGIERFKKEEDAINRILRKV